MDMIVLDNTLTAWTLAGLVAIALGSGLLLLRRVAMSRLTVFSARTDNGIDDLILSVVRATRTWFLVGVAAWAAARIQLIGQTWPEWLTVIAVLGLVLQAALWGNAAIMQLVQTQVQRRMDADAASATTMAALGFLARLLLWTVLLLVGLDNIGVDVTTLVAGLGVGGIAVALAVQNVLGDLFGSLSIVLDKPFVNGDFIVVGDLAGTVEHIGLKTTRVRSLSGEQLVFSNADLLSSRIRNYKRMQERRVLFKLGVTYDTSAQKVATIPRIIREVIQALPDVRFDRAHFSGFGDFSLDIEVVYYVLDTDYNRYMELQQAINLGILHRFSAEGIEFAFPTQTLHVTAAQPARKTFVEATLHARS